MQWNSSTDLPQLKVANQACHQEVVVRPHHLVDRVKCSVVLQGRLRCNKDLPVCHHPVLLRQGKYNVVLQGHLRCSSRVLLVKCHLLCEEANLCHSHQ